jgi:hypothetical protein
MKDPDNVFRQYNTICFVCSHELKTDNLIVSINKMVHSNKAFGSVLTFVLPVQLTKISHSSYIDKYVLFLMIV